VVTDRSRRTPGGAAALAVSLGIGLALARAPLAEAADENLPAARAAEGSWGYALWSDLMSPFCPGRTLADCTSGEAEQLRTWILVQAASGRSRDEVEAELVAQYGDVILSAPRAEGIGLAAYLLPAAAFALGGSGVVWFLRRQTRRTTPEAPPGAGSATPSAFDPELARAVDAEIQRRQLG
jgi:cytochrome c-type biogenesis protein CcmH/NrfF